MNIEIMKVSQLDEVVELDKQCFGRSEARTKENVHALFEISYGGAFIGSVDQKIIAYLFTHSYGTIGTIGPLGVLEEYRRKGYAKQIIRKSIDYLCQRGCSIIGLEVLPEKVENIGLYLKLGFRFVQPSLVLELKTATYLLSDNCISGEYISQKQISDFCNQFQTKHSNYSLRADIDWVINHNPTEIIFYQQEHDIKGFMCYSPDLYRYVFGYVSEDIDFVKVFHELYNTLCTRYNYGNLKIRVNSKYCRIFELLGYEVHIEKVIVRMELSLEDNDHELEKDIIFRSWIG